MITFFYYDCFFLAAGNLGHYHCTNLRQENKQYNTSGLYSVIPGPSNANGAGHITVFCDMSLDSENDGWTVIQRRVAPSTSANDYVGAWNKSWYQYKTGFGDLHGNFWLGLHNIRRILLSPGIDSTQSTFDLYIGMVTSHPSSPLHRCAYYHDFKIGPEEEDFKLTIGSFDTTLAGNFCGSANAVLTQDGLTSHSNDMFSTYDHDKDGSTSINCAESHGGGWWFKNCYESHLNGMYNDGIKWIGITESDYIESVVMAIKLV